MNAEKKLGLAFVGILSVTFCGVLTMRLLDANKAEQIDINVGPPVGSAPQFDSSKGDAAKSDGSASTTKPVAPAAPQPPEISRYANTASPAVPKSGSYLPPMSKSPSPAGDSAYGGGRYGTPASGGATAASPYGGATASPAAENAATPTAGPAAPAPISNPYGSTASRYGAPALPSTPSAPPSFASTTPTAAATLAPPATPSTSTATGSPYGTPMPAAPTPPAAPSMTAATSASGDNPLRSSRSFDSASTGSVMPLSTSSTEPGLIGSGGATASLASSGSPYSAPSIPSAPATSSLSTASSLPASAPPSFAATSGTMSPSSTGNSMREPRAFDASAAPSQPLSSSAAPIASNSPGLNPTTSNAVPTYTVPSRTSESASLGTPSQNGSGFNTGFADTNSLRAPSPTASPAGGFANGGQAGGSVAPVAAAMPVAAPAVKNTAYVVEPDDNFWSISKKVYGDASYYRALFAYNSDRYPHAEDVRAGSVLDVPSAEVLKQRYPELVNGAVGGDGRPTDATLAGGRTPAAAAATTYTVRDGDTLFDIARRQLGKASRWNEIYELNRAALGENLENLRPGMQIQLPQ